MPVLPWVISLTLSRRGVRLSFNWVNVEWDSTSTESTWSETPRQQSQRRRHQHLRRFYHSTLTQLTWSLTLRWLSLRRVSLGVDSVDEEWDFALTESPPNVKKFEYIGEFKNKIENIQKPYYLAYMCSISAKNEKKKSHASVPLKPKLIFLKLVIRRAKNEETEHQQGSPQASKFPNDKYFSATGLAVCYLKPNPRGTVSLRRR